MTTFVESPIVRRNLERAFRKSPDKLEWFLALRNHGVSQEFYEYILEEMRLPLKVLIEDLKAKRVEPTHRLREALIRNLTTLVPTFSDCDGPLVAEALRFLTPLEKQDAIVSRFVVAEPEAFLLTDEILELLWEKRDQVGDEVLKTWLDKILSTVTKRSKTPIVLRWIHKAWEHDHLWRKLYSPQSLGLSLDSLDIYLSILLEAHKDDARDGDLILEQALLSEDDSWISRLVLNSVWMPQDPRLIAAIENVKDAYLKAKLNGERARRALDRDLEVESLRIIYEESPLLAEKLEAGSRILDLCANRLAQCPEQDLRAMEQTCEKMLAPVHDRALKLRALWNDRRGAWDRLTEWWRAAPAERSELLDRLLSAATEAQTIEDLQRLLVDYVLEGEGDSDQRDFILDLLLDDGSPYRLKYLRREFIDSALKIHPLHRLLLLRRSTDDFRATLLLKIFYGERGHLHEPLAVGKRKHLFWGMAAEKMSISSWPHANKIFHTNLLPTVGQTAVELEKFADRLGSVFNYKLKGKYRLQVQVVKDLDCPFRIRLPDRTLDLSLSASLHGHLELMRFVICGALQVLHDYDEGLFDSVALSDRFFRGGLLSGVSMTCVLKFIIETEASLRGFDSALVKEWDQATLIRSLPTLRDFLVLFLSQEYEDRIHQSGLIVH